MGISSQTITPDALWDLMRAERPFALIDLRDLGAFSTGHLFMASCLPLSRLELLTPSRLPRKHIPIVLLSGSADDAYLTERGAQVLADAGYTDLYVLPGGTEAWAGTGREVFTGVNVPSKAFGEFVEHWYDTPRMTAAELHERQQRGDKLIVLDSRPFEEFQRMSIPAGRDCPGAELVRRIHDEIDDPEKLVVVNCAGRTRSIIGAQSLINAGIPNPVVALKDGTMGWKLAGLTLERGKTSVVPPPSDAGLAAAVAAARRVASQCGVRTIEPAEVATWLADEEQFTVVLDIRTRDEFVEGHWPGAIHAPGGQLVQATDEYVSVRNARLVLCDSADGVRGTMTAHWLLQLAWPSVSVVVAQAPDPVRGPDEQHWPLPAGVAEVSAKEWADNSVDSIVLDLSVSRVYKTGHLPGAAWTSRARLAEALDLLTAEQPDKKAVLLAGPGDGSLSFAAADVQRLRPDLSVSVLAGQPDSWLAAGLPVETDNARWIHAPEDVWLAPSEGKVNPEQAMQQYLDWEVGLVDQVEREGLITFNKLM